MSTPNPLIPQGTLQAKAARGASNIRIAVATIIAIHVVFFGGLLLQGCKRDNKGGLAAQTNTPAPETNLALSLPPMDANATSMYYTNASSLPSESSNRYAASPSANIPTTPDVSSHLSNAPLDAWPAGTATPGAGLTDTVTKDYVVAKGDSFYKIAKLNHTTIAALQKANPTLDASKLRPGMKIKVPAGDSTTAPSGSTAAGTGSGLAASASTGAAEGKVYVVKPGDTLSRIARQNGVTATSIRTANNMKTTRVNAGQKLKIPARSDSNAPAPATKAASTTSTNATF